MSEADRADRRTRRSLLGVLSAAAVTGVAGCVGRGSSTETVTPEEPNDDGEASLGELRWLLENNGDEAVTLSVTEMTYAPGEDVIHLTYESAAKERERSERTAFHVEEVGHVLRQYAIYVESDGASGEARGEKLDATVTETYRGQPELYHVERAWAEKLNAGASKREVLQQVLKTGKIVGTTRPPTTAAGTTAAGASTTTD